MSLSDSQYFANAQAPAALAASLILRDSTASYCLQHISKSAAHATDFKTSASAIIIPKSCFLQDFKIRLSLRSPQNNSNSIKHFRRKASTFVSHIKNVSLYLPKQPPIMPLLRYLRHWIDLPTGFIYRSSRQSCPYFGICGIKLTCHRSSFTEAADNHALTSVFAALNWPADSIHLPK